VVQQQLALALALEHLVSGIGPPNVTQAVGLLLVRSAQPHLFELVVDQVARRVLIGEDIN